MNLMTGGPSGSGYLGVSLTDAGAKVEGRIHRVYGVYHGLFICAMEPIRYWTGFMLSIFSMSDYPFSFSM
jgi:hypothetical protein